MSRKTLQYECLNNNLLTGKKVTLSYRNELEVSYNVREFIEVTKVTRFTG